MGETGNDVDAAVWTADLQHRPLGRGGPPIVGTTAVGTRLGAIEQRRGGTAVDAAGALRRGLHTGPKGVGTVVTRGLKVHLALQFSSWIVMCLCPSGLVLVYTLGLD